QVYESQRENDNLASAPLALRHVDLRADRLVAVPSATSGDTIQVAFDVTQAGTAALTGNWTDRLYLSRDTVLDANDRLLGIRDVTATLNPGDTYRSSFTVTLPIDAEGPWYLIGQADAGHLVNEVGAEANNTTSAPITVALAPYADLQTSAVTAPSQTIGDPARLTVSWTVSNAGTGVGQSTDWVDRIIASRDGVLGNGDDIVLGTYSHSGALAVGDSYTRSELVLAPPSLSGRFTLFVQADSAGQVFENGLESNNAASTAPVDIMPIAYADLQVVSAGTAASAQSGGTVTVTWRVENRGIGRTDLSAWSDRVTLATNADGSGVVVSGSFDHLGALSAGSGYDRSGTLTLPQGLSGTFYVFVDTGAPYEFIYGDNNRRLAGQVTVTVAPSADLIVQSITAPAAANEGSAIQISWTVLNQGEAAATGNIGDLVQLVKSGDPSVVPLTLGYFNYAAGLEAGKFYTRTERFVLPAHIEGGWVVRVTTNVGSQVFELGTRADNNTTLDDQLLLLSANPRPDLQVSTIDAPAAVTAGSGFAVTYQVVNRGTVGTAGRWNDKVYLSLDNKFSGDDLLLDSVANPQALDALVSAYSATTRTVSVPTRYQGQAYILVVADGDNALDEHPNDANNITARAITINPYPPADLVASNVSAPVQAVYGSEIEVRFKVTNNGVNLTDKTNWVDSVWLARDKTRPTPGLKDENGNVIGNGGIFIGSAVHTGVLAVGESYEAVIKVRIPAVIESGSYFITPWTDAYDAVLEDTFTPNPDDPAEIDSNNYKARPIDIIGNPTPPLPDLQVTSVVADATGSTDAPFTVSWTVQNRDDGNANDWVDSVFVSDLPYGSPGAKTWFLGSFSRVKSLGRLESYTNTQSFMLSPAVKASYVTVITDTNPGMPFVVESHEDNNSASTATQIVPRPADLVPLSLTAQAQNFSGEKTTVSWTVQNQGQAVWSGTKRWIDEVWISPDPVFGGRALRLGSVLHDNSSGLAAGQSYTETADFTLPAGIDGPYYLHLIIDAAGGQPMPEDVSNRNDYSLGKYSASAYEPVGLDNNRLSTTLPVTYREPDLVISTQGYTVPPTASSGDLINVGYTVTNQGNRATRQDRWIDRIYLSRDPSLDGNDLQVGSFMRYGGLAAGASYTQNFQLQLPEGAEGRWYLIAYTDSDLVGLNIGDPSPTETGRIGYTGDAVPEFRGEGNNVTVKPIDITLRASADLQVQAGSVNIPERVLTGQVLDLSYTVVNAGAGSTPPAQTSWTDRIYLSTDSSLDLNADRQIGEVQHTGGLAAGASYSVNKSIRLGNDLVGPYYVFVVTDPADRSPRGKVYEGSHEGNNATASVLPLLIEQPPPADLVVTSFNLPQSGAVNQDISLSWTVKNQGQFAAQGSWSDAVYLSADGEWSLDDIRLGQIDHAGTIDPGASYTTPAKTFTLPPMKAGQYRIIVRPDIYNQVYEGNDEGNNITPSSNTLSVTVPELQLGVTQATTLKVGVGQLYKVHVDAGQTLRFSLDAARSDAADEIYVRWNDVPSAAKFDASFNTPLQPDQTAVVPTS
ncbi:MAG: hypothetical protein K2Q07_03835, partial [Burkholderiaceae bacterium]|nr:hypothetical protein [Burkholderiaceae bacterium]